MLFLGMLLSIARSYRGLPTLCLATGLSCTLLWSVSAVFEGVQNSGLTLAILMLVSFGSKPALKAAYFEEQ